jgi:hypothetical protein
MESITQLGMSPSEHCRRLDEKWGRGRDRSGHFEPSGPALRAYPRGRAVGIPGGGCWRAEGQQPSGRQSLTRRSCEPATRLHVERKIGA